jgi:hypothetical protein
MRFSIFSPPHFRLSICGARPMAATGLKHEGTKNTKATKNIEDLVFWGAEVPSDGAKSFRLRAVV